MEVQPFVSTGAFSGKTIVEILNICLEHGIPALELSSGSKWKGSNDLAALLTAKERGMKFLVHNYFPPPTEPFVLNLASADPDILRASRDHCSRAMTLCRLLGSPFFSVHAGFCFHAHPDDLGQDQRQLPRFPMERAFNTFMESLHLLLQHAKSIEIDLLVENNVCAPFNLEHGKNELLLGVTAEGCLQFFKALQHPRLGLLMDVGHLKVSAEALGFDPKAAVKRLLPHIRAWHLSDNDGQRDSNGPLRGDSWFWEIISQHPAQACVLEVYGLSLQDILQQCALIREQRPALRSP